VPYLHAPVYHARETAEQPTLFEHIEAAAGTDEFRRELTAMRETGAESLIKKGRKEGEKRGELRARREALLELLRVRLREVPAAAEAKVKGTRDVEQLKSWHLRAATADTLADVGILE
jgi:hypothetical protein